MVDLIAREIDMAIRASRLVDARPQARRTALNRMVASRFIIVIVGTILTLLFLLALYVTWFRIPRDVEQQ